MSFSVARSLLGLWFAATLLTGCSQVVHELKAARNPQAVALHEQLSAAIHDAGFSHGIRSVREDKRDIDSIFVAIPLDSLKRQHITLHQMLFTTARLCARPEFADVSILIELNAADEKDRAYMRSVVEPIVAEARNVTVVSEREAAGDLVITLSKGLAKPAAKDSGAATR